MGGAIGGRHPHFGHRRGRGAGSRMHGGAMPGERPPDGLVHRHRHAGGYGGDHVPLRRRQPRRGAANCRFVSVDGGDHTWDDLGRLNADGTYTYAWDGAGRLIGLTGGITAVVYAYDGDGNPVVAGRTAGYPGRSAGREQPTPWTLRQAQGRLRAWRCPR
jgi:hypothetical protein